MSEFPSVWTRPPRARRDQTLSREQIVAEAMRLLDSEGLEALSMRRLGSRLNAGATSMYTHVANKDELIELVVDEVFGEIDLPSDTGWRAEAFLFGCNLRAAILRHRWIPIPLAQIAVSGPNLLRLSERLLVLFQDSGFPRDEAEGAVKTLVAYVLGMATSEAAWLTMLARIGEDEQSFVARVWPAAEQVAGADHPRLLEAYAAQPPPDAAGTRDSSFTYGLDRVLDGLATRVV